ncbi:hypothetical protein CBW65_02720 [Tumebacillus avium]|uniref:Bacterial spore germination immunoglobulin-like domain-containing protein n=1 Tax=Tumebacillus avium TaxID=1903704 RepID=A0A1Y0II06_9BACL|nr:hypothetical protein [Tumebacillus avium]ARU60088.1 hypothetical protein CBW65_02720 [Tumebacillus avium]
MRKFTKLLAAAVLITSLATPVGVSADTTMHVHIDNYTNAADRVQVPAPVGTVIRVYKLENGVYTQLAEGISQGIDYDRDGVPNYELATVLIEAGLGDLTNIYVTAQAPGEAESDKVVAAVPTATPEMAPAANDLTAAYGHGLYEVTVQNVPSGAEVYVYESAGATQFLAGNFNAEGTAAPVSIMFNADTLPETVYVSYLINHAETALVPVQVTLDVQKAVTLENYYTGSDTVSVYGLPGYTARVYDAAVGGTLLGEATIDESQYSLIELAAGLDGMQTVYVTLTKTGQTEGARTAFTCPVIPDAPLAEQIHVNRDANGIAVVVENVPAGVYVNVQGPAGSDLRGGVYNDSGETGTFTIPVYGTPTSENSVLNVSFFIRNEDDHGAESPSLAVTIPML